MDATKKSRQVFVTVTRNSYTFHALTSKDIKARQVLSILRRSIQNIALAARCPRQESSQKHLQAQSSRLVFLVQLSDLLLHVPALIARLCHARQSSLARHAADTVVRASLSTSPPRSFFFADGLASRLVEDVGALAGQTFEVVGDFRGRQVCC